MGSADQVLIRKTVHSVLSFTQEAHTVTGSCKKLFLSGPSPETFIHLFNLEWAMP